jgi:hypothetical protein
MELPVELHQLFGKLHHFGRGTIMGEGFLQSSDDRSLARDIFLRSPLAVCISMMAPSSWRCVSDANLDIKFKSTPAETLTLWDESILAVDTFDRLFVWSGTSVLGEQFDHLRKACLSYLLDRSKSRFPAPQLHGLIEGDPLCRELTSRLAPSHGDQDDVQLQHFPDLATLNSQSLVFLRGKFRIYNKEKDPSLRHWFSNASQTPGQGKSLCC